MPTRQPADHDDVRRDHAPLREHGAERRAGDPPAESVDEDPVQERVRAEAEAGDPQRRDGVLHAAQQPGRGEHDQHRGQPPHREPEVDLRLARDLRARAEEPDEEGSREVADEGEHRPDAEREPHPVDADRHRPRRVAGAEPAGDGRGGRVREEDHEPDDRLQHGRGDAEPGERDDAEVADERRVHDEEQRLRDERPECGHGEPQDVAVQRVAGHLSSLESGAHRVLRPPTSALGPLAPAGTCEPVAFDAYPVRMTDSRSGLALDELSAEIRPQDDLFRHVNGAWLERTEIPEDKARWGSFHLIAEQAEKDVHAIVEETQVAEPGTESRKIGDLYTSFMDTERIAELGGTPLLDQLARVDAIASVPALLRTLGELERDGIGGLIGLYVEPDPGNPQRYVPFLVQGGLSLPDESYYRLDNFARPPHDLPRPHPADAGAGRSRRMPRHPLIGSSRSRPSSPRTTGTTSAAAMRSRRTTS